MSWDLLQCLPELTCVAPHNLRKGQVTVQFNKERNRALIFVQRALRPYLSFSPALECSAESFARDGGCGTNRRSLGRVDKFTCIATLDCVKSLNVCLENSGPQLTKCNPLAIQIDLEVAQEH